MPNDNTLPKVNHDGEAAGLLDCDVISKLPFLSLWVHRSIPRNAVRDDYVSHFHQQVVVHSRSRPVSSNEFVTTVNHFALHPEDAISNSPVTMLVYCVDYAYPGTINGATLRPLCHQTERAPYARAVTYADVDKLLSCLHIIAPSRDKFDSPLGYFVWAYLKIESMEQWLLFHKLEMAISSDPMVEAGCPYSLSNLKTEDAFLNKYGPVERADRIQVYLQHLCCLRASPIDGSKRVMTSGALFTGLWGSTPYDSSNSYPPNAGAYMEGVSEGVVEKLRVRKQARKHLLEYECGAVFIAPTHREGILSDAIISTCRSVGVQRQIAVGRAVPLSLAELMLHHSALQADALGDILPWQLKPVEFTMNGNAVYTREFQNILAKLLPDGYDASEFTKANTWKGISGKAAESVQYLVMAGARRIEDPKERMSFVLEAIPVADYTKFETYMSRKGKFSDWKEKIGVHGVCQPVNIRTRSVVVAAYLAVSISRAVNSRARAIACLESWVCEDSRLSGVRDHTDKYLDFALLLVRRLYTPVQNVMHAVKPMDDLLKSKAGKKIMKEEGRDSGLSKCHWRKQLRHAGIVCEFMILYRLGESGGYKLPTDQDNVAKILRAFGKMSWGHDKLYEPDREADVRPSELYISDNYGTRYYPTMGIENFVPEFIGMNGRSCSATGWAVACMDVDQKHTKATKSNTSQPTQEKLDIDGARILVSMKKILWKVAPTPEVSVAPPEPEVNVKPPESISEQAISEAPSLEVSVAHQETEVSVEPPESIYTLTPLPRIQGEDHVYFSMIDEEEDTVRKLLFVKVPGDGDCFFHAICLHYTCRFRDAHDLRTAVAQHVRDNSIHYLTMYSEVDIDYTDVDHRGKRFAEYMETMATQYEYVDQYMIVATANYLKRDLLIYNERDCNNPRNKPTQFINYTPMSKLGAAPEPVSQNRPDPIPLHFNGLEGWAGHYSGLCTAPEPSVSQIPRSPTDQKDSSDDEDNNDDKKGGGGSKCLGGHTKNKSKKTMRQVSLPLPPTAPAENETRFPTEPGDDENAIESVEVGEADDDVEIDVVAEVIDDDDDDHEKTRTTTLKPTFSNENTTANYVGGDDDITENIPVEEDPTRKESPHEQPRKVGVEADGTGDVGHESSSPAQPSDDSVNQDDDFYTEYGTAETETTQDEDGNADLKPEEKRQEGDIPPKDQRGGGLAHLLDGYGSSSSDEDEDEDEGDDEGSHPESIPVGEDRTRKEREESSPHEEPREAGVDAEATVDLDADDTQDATKESSSPAKPSDESNNPDEEFPTESGTAEGETTQEAAVDLDADDTQDATKESLSPAKPSDESNNRDEEFPTESGTAEGETTQDATKESSSPAKPSDDSGTAEPETPQDATGNSMPPPKPAEARGGNTDDELSGGDRKSSENTTLETPSDKGIGNNGTKETDHSGGDKKRRRKDKIDTGSNSSPVALRKSSELKSPDYFSPEDESYKTKRKLDGTNSTPAAKKQKGVGAATGPDTSPNNIRIMKKHTPTHQIANSIKGKQRQKLLKTVDALTPEMEMLIRRVMKASRVGMDLKTLLRIVFEASKKEGKK